jgi:hypothetical protein
MFKQAFGSLLLLIMVQQVAAVEKHGVYMIQSVRKGILPGV